jgi:hypothetical protein
VEQYNIVKVNNNNNNDNNNDNNDYNNSNNNNPMELQIYATGK